MAALAYRAHDLGYIDDRRYRALQIHAAANEEPPQRKRACLRTMQPRWAEVDGEDVNLGPGERLTHLPSRFSFKSHRDRVNAGRILTP